MSTVKRSSIVKRMIRRKVFGMPEQRYFISGDRACRGMMQNARRRCRKTDKEEASILFWARFDLMLETVSGFWDRKAMRAA